MVDPAKIESMLSWPKPTTLKGLRGFLSLTRYYQHFIWDYEKINQPLIAMLKKDNFHWTSESKAAFNHLKKAMTTAHVLAMPDFSNEFMVECDTSENGLRAVLKQEGCPVAFSINALSNKSLRLFTHMKRNY